MQGRPAQRRLHRRFGGPGDGEEGACARRVRRVAGAAVRAEHAEEGGEDADDEAWFWFDLYCFGDRDCSVLKFGVNASLGL